MMRGDVRASAKEELQVIACTTPLPDGFQHNAIDDTQWPTKHSKYSLFSASTSHVNSAEEQEKKCYEDGGDNWQSPCSHAA